MAKHTLSQITRSPKTWSHLGSRFDATFRSFDRSQKCLSRHFSACALQRLYERIQGIQHRPVPRFGPAQFANGAAALIERLGPLRETASLGVLKNVAATQKKHSIERSR